MHLLVFSVLYGPANEFLRGDWNWINSKFLFTDFSFVFVVSIYFYSVYDFANL